MKNWRQKEQKRYNDMYKGKAHYGASDFEKYSVIFPEIKGSNKNVIDLACGAAHLSKHYSNYTGVDISSEIIKRNRNVIKGALFYVGALDDLTRWHGWKYDIAFCNDVLEHVPVEMTGLVVKEMSKIDANVFYFKIHKGHSNFEDSQGNLHRTQRDHDFWYGVLSNWFNIEKDYTKGKGLSGGYLSYFKCTRK